MQTTLYFKKIIIFIMLATICVILGAEAVEEWEKLSKEEELELDRQLKLINKPAIKSFQTEYGDVIDCVDIYKQLAFDHPMLKNHTIQMKPTTIPKGMMGNETQTTYKSSPYMLGNIQCPQGSVPIRRASRKNLIMAKLIKSLGFNHPTNTHARTSEIDIAGHHVRKLFDENFFAGLAYRHPVAGGRAKINVWNPSVKINQFSIASMSIANGRKEQMNNIQVGWEVNQYLYPDGSRLYTYWTGDGYHQTGCFNTLCPGFVQVSSKIHLGLNLHPVSIYSGPQFEIAISIHQDNGTRNWLLMFFDEYVGYWPKEIISNMAGGGDHISWGGEVYSIITELSPAMGSGHFPPEGWGKAAYVDEIQVIPNRSSEYKDPNKHSLKLYADATHCYDVKEGVNKDSHYILYGGPGNCTFLVD